MFYFSFFIYDQEIYLVIKVTEVHLSCLIVFILYLIGLTRIMLYILIFYTPPRFTQETHDQSLKCGEERQNQCLF